MSWTTPDDLRAQVQRLWDRGLILASLVNGDDLFPRRLVLKGPSSAELSNRFEEARPWIAALRAIKYIRIEMREIRHRVLGANHVPSEAWVDSFEDAVACLGRTRETERFRSLVSTASERESRLLPWLGRHPLKALELADAWPRLIDVVKWMQANPHPGVYLRQIDIPGVHSKFIEAHRSVLSSLLDLTLPASAIDAEAKGASQFARRYGFREKPVRVRFRMLDSRIQLLPGVASQDISLTHDTFARMQVRVTSVFITENETNFLAFPDMPQSLVIFGAGYGFDMLAEAGWLRDCAVHYWGDIDTHGFAILDQLRGCVPHAESFLMDRATLIAHKAHWGEEPSPIHRDLNRLRPTERELFDDLRDNRLGRAVRLEQEKVGFTWLKSTLEHLTR